MIRLICVISLCLSILTDSVISGNLNKSMRVMRDLKEKRTLNNSNHPPLVESYIPVKVIYDESEDTNQQTKSIKEDKITNFTTDEIKSNYSLRDDGINVAKEKVNSLLLFADHPPEAMKDSSAIDVKHPEDKDNKDDDNVKTLFVDKKEKEPLSSVQAESDADNLNMSKILINTNDNLGSEQKLSSNFDKKSTQRKGRRQQVQRRLPNEARKLKVNQSKQNLNDNTSDKKNHELEMFPEIKENNDQKTSYKTFPKRTEEIKPIVRIVDSENYVYAYNGDYRYRYEGGDGTKAFERGELKTAENGSSGTGVVGGYSYKDKDGNDFSLSYTADENGYRPIGAHLPTPPPIPIAIQRALALLATKTTPEPITERVNKYH